MSEGRLLRRSTIDTLQSSPDAIPTLRLLNTKNKPLLRTRAGEPTTLNPETMSDLRSGDSITIAGGISVS